MKLTDLAIRSLPLPEKGQRTYWDKGFGIRVSQGGSKTFIVKVGGKWLTIGKYPRISLKDARKQALSLKVAPSPKTRLESTTEAVRAYLEDCQTRLRHNTYREYERHLLKAPDVPLSQLKRDQIDLSSPERVKTWKVFFNWCIRNELTDKNPFAYIPVKYGQRSRVLTNDELRDLWHYTWPPYSDYLKLLILTGQRRGQFNTFEIRDDTLYFPAEIMKGKVEHTIPATPYVLELCDRLEPFNGWSKAKKRADLHTGVTGWTLHDCRRTFSTNCAALGIPLHVTERILAHSSGSISGVAAIYNRHTYMQEMRQALETHEKYIHSVIT